MRATNLTRDEGKAFLEMIQLLNTVPLADIKQGDIEAIIQRHELREQVETVIRAIVPFFQAEDRRKIESQFTTPTGLLPILPTFGLTDIPEGKSEDAGPVDVKRWIFMPSDDREKDIQLEIPFEPKEQGVEPLEGQLRKICDPLGLKVLLGALYFCHKHKRQNWFYFDENAFCDLLGYARTKSGYHRQENKEMIQSKIRFFEKVIYKCEWSGGVRKRAGLEGRLLMRDEKSNAYIIIDDKPIYRGQVIYFNGPLYDDIREHGLYSWVDKRFLELDSRKYGRVIRLGTYYSTAWRIDWQNSKGKLHRKLRTILIDSGTPIGADQRHLSRTIDAIKRDHDFMAHEGLIKDWRIVEYAGNPLDEVWEIVIPDNHALKILSK